MPAVIRAARTLAAACLVAGSLLAAGAGPAAALEPPRPLPGYRPAFVTETDTRPWKDCLWASGAMLLDKWTNGDIEISRQALRGLSGDAHGGSTLADLQVAYAKLGIDLAYSPDGGTTVTWSQLLSRLEHGAGAVLLGDDSKLPRRYGRWDPSFWQATDDKDNHAVYIERYERRYGRVWLMDPLGRGDWQGEWISVKALRKYAWTTGGGALSVAVTPTAKPAPFAGVTLASPTVTLNPATLEVAWSFKTPRGWAFPGADVTTAFTTADDPLALALMPRPVPAGAAPMTAPQGPLATVSGHWLHATAPLPSAPGAYAVTTTVTDRRFGKVLATSENVPLFIPGPRRATLRLHVTDGTMVAGAPISVTVSVANTGDVTWSEDIRPVGAPIDTMPIRDTRVVARWIAVDAPVDPTAGDQAASDSSAAVPVSGAVLATSGVPIAVADPLYGTDAPLPAGPPAFELRRVPLAPGRLVQVSAEILAPDAPGTWALVIDVVDDVDGSFAALGSAPAVHEFLVVAARGIAPLD
jgi:hypothetical protein